MDRNQLKARNGLQRVRTTPGVQPGAVLTPRFVRGRLNSNLLRSEWLHGVEPGPGFDSQQPQRKDLNLPREGGMLVQFPGLTWKGALPLTLAPNTRREAKSVMMGYPLSFLWKGVHSNKQTMVGPCT